jgi:hypothetical protein
MKNQSVNIQNSSFQGNFIQGDVSGNVQLSGSSTDAEHEFYQAASQIQSILDQLSNSHSTDTVSGKMRLATKAVSIIEKDLNLRQRIVSALKVGSISSLEQLLSHPAASFVIAAIQDWQQTADSK